MNTYLALTLGTVGTLAGLYLCGLGIAALKYLPNLSEVNRTVGWTLWWWLDWKRYEEEGRKLCRKGGWVFILAIACWLLAVLFWKRLL